MWRKVDDAMHHLSVTPGVGEIKPPLVHGTRAVADQGPPSAAERLPRKKGESASRAKRASSKQSSSETSSAHEAVCTSTGCPQDGADPADLMQLSPDFWTEKRVREHFAKSQGELPLVRVHEMHVRMNASHKFYCEFANAHGERCMVWLADTLLFAHYPSVYTDIKGRFVEAASR